MVEEDTLENMSVLLSDTDTDSWSLQLQIGLFVWQELRDSEYKERGLVSLQFEGFYCTHSVLEWHYFDGLSVTVGVIAVI